MMYIKQSKGAFFCIPFFLLLPYFSKQLVLYRPSQADYSSIPRIILVVLFITSPDNK